MELLQTLGLLVGSMIVALRVTRGESEPYEFVFFITYLAQVRAYDGNVSVGSTLIDHFEAVRTFEHARIYLSDCKPNPGRHREASQATQRAHRCQRQTQRS